MDREQGKGKGMKAYVKVKSEMEAIIYKNVNRFDIVQKGAIWFLYLELGSYQNVYIALDDILRFTMNNER